MSHSRRVYTGRVLNLDIDTVEFPDGHVGELEMIRHPGASAVVPIIGRASERDLELILVHQYRYAAEDRLYEVPAGRLAVGETPHACAVRELQEETGYSPGAIEHLAFIYTTPGFTDERIHIFLASELTPGESNHEADEFMENYRCRLSDALAMIGDGRIRDAKTMAALLFAARYRLRFGL